MDNQDTHMDYAHLDRAPRLTLLYPHHKGLGETEGIQALFRITGQETVLEPASVDVAFGEDILSRLRGKILPEYRNENLVII